MIEKVSGFTRWLVGTEPKDTRHSLAPGEPPIPGLDRHHRPLPPAWLKKLQMKLRGFRHRLDRWIRNGCPVIPKIKMDTRSPQFVLLVMALVALGMVLPEIFGLTTGSFYSAYPPSL